MYLENFIKLKTWLVYDLFMKINIIKVFQKIVVFKLKWNETSFKVPNVHLVFHFVCYFKKDWGWRSAEMSNRQ